MNKQRKIRAAMSGARGISFGLQAKAARIMNNLNASSGIRQTGKTLITGELVHQAFLNLGADSYILPRAHAVLRRFRSSLKFNYRPYTYGYN